jgi:zinc transporter 1/2/3
MGLHVGAVFIILVASCLGVLLPILTGWHRRAKSEREGERTLTDSTAFGRETHFMGSVFFIARHFGTVS